MSSQDGLICAYIRSGEGQWREVDWQTVRGWQPGDGLLWVHLDRTEEVAKAYLQNESGLDGIVAENLLAEGTRPRALEVAGNLLLNLRGVNLNPNADPDDMVSLRLWLEPARIITSRHRQLIAINDLRERIARGSGPSDTGDFLVEVAAGLVDRMSPIIEDLDDAEDNLEEQVVTGERQAIRANLTDLRRQAIGLRRYLAPQREAMSRVVAEPIDWLDARHRARLRETSDRIMRYVEDLDAIRERAAVIQDEVANRVAESMNMNMYILALVAAILLPLGFLTGLLGVNVDGIPFSKDAPWAFGAVAALCAVIVVVEIVIMRRMKWF